MRKPRAVPELLRDSGSISETEDWRWPPEKFISPRVSALPAGRQPRNEAANRLTDSRVPRSNLPKLQVISPASFSARSAVQSATSVALWSSAPGHDRLSDAGTRRLQGHANHPQVRASPGWELPGTHHRGHGSRHAGRSGKSALRREWTSTRANRSGLPSSM
jgi:hypothetical protein